MFKLPEDLDSKYRFATLAALRAEQLQAGVRPRLQSKHRKPTVIAQEEVAAGLIKLWDPERAAEAQAQQEGDEPEREEA